MGRSAGTDSTWSNTHLTAGILRPRFNASTVQRDLGAQVQISQTFTQKAPRAVAELSHAIGQQPIDDANNYLRAGMAALWQ